MTMENLGLIYKTVEKFAKIENVYKNSLFIGYVKPVDTENEAKEFVKYIKELHKDATHNVSAYYVKEHNNNNYLAMKYDDDGEPSGSSGKPIFKVLELKNVQNVVIVITRYFGGVKLGYGGLVKAYGETANDAIEEAGIIGIYDTLKFKLEFGYGEINNVKKAIEDTNTNETNNNNTNNNNNNNNNKNVVKIYSEEYSEDITYNIDIVKGYDDIFIKNVVNYTKNNLKIHKLNKRACFNKLINK
ncbi:IMPACT family protein [Methanococcus voltae]|uniref:Impact N-terminal domain-containing protein n=1 Tax=Methanococcus voltae (strain ATCC BAA-1334 / A3) TaxID=456320 RepID=D7DU14_METV3|nr:YigZ family protein [Methanococcus voltae]MCS3900424.1 putative YigZ family protein [Methanococcus voltae]